MVLVLTQYHTVEGQFTAPGALLPVLKHEQSTRLSDLGCFFLFMRP